MRKNIILSLCLIAAYVAASQEVVFTVSDVRDTVYVAGSHIAKVKDTIHSTDTLVFKNKASRLKLYGSGDQRKIELTQNTMDKCKTIQDYLSSARSMSNQSTNGEGYTITRDADGNGHTATFGCRDTTLLLQDTLFYTPCKAIGQTDVLELHILLEDRSEVVLPLTPTADGSFYLLRSQVAIAAGTYNCDIWVRNHDRNIEDIMHKKLRLVKTEL